MAVTSPELTTKIALELTPANEREKRVLELTEAAKNKSREGSDKKAEHILENLQATGLAPLRDKEIRKDIEKVIPGSNIGTDGKRVKTTEESEKATRAERSGQLVKRFLETDYQSLDDATKVYLEGMVENILSSLPLVQAQFESGILNKREAIQNLLKNKELKPLVRRLFEKNIRPEEVFEQLDPKLQADFEKAKNKRNSLDQEKQRIQEQLNSVNETLNKFTVSAGSEGEELIKLKGSRVSDDLAIRQVSRDIERKQAQYARAAENEDHIRDGYIDASGAVHPPDPTRADTYHDTVVVRVEQELERLEGKKKVLDEKLTRVVQLETTKQEAENQKRQLQDNLERISNQLEDVNYNFHLAQATLLDAQNKLSEKQDKYVGDLQSVIPQAVQQMLIQRIEEAEAGQRELLTKEQEETIDKAKKGILNTLNTRWDSVVTKNTLFGSSQVTEYKPSQINADFSRLVFGGPRSVMKEILISPSVGLTAEQAEERLSDSTFYSELEPKVIETLMRKKVATGKLSEPEARIIIESSWGKDAIEKALTSKTELKNKIQELKVKEGINLNTKDWLKRLSNKKLVRLMLIIFGALGLGYAGYSAIPLIGKAASLGPSGLAAEATRAITNLASPPSD